MSDTRWLIERETTTGTEWAYFTDTGGKWTKDADKACGFCRRSDAEQLAYGEDCWKITEHIFD